MKPIPILQSLFTICFACSIAHGQLPTEVSAQLEKQNIIWNTPSDDAKGSMPIGNGDLGLNMWLEPSGDLCFFIGKNDAWNENMILCKVGKVRVKFTPALVEDDQALEWKLDLEGSRILITTDKAEVVLWVDAHHNVIQIDAKGLNGEKIAASASYEIWRTEKRKIPSALIRQYYAIDGSQITYPDTAMKATGKQVGWFHRNPDSSWPATLEVQNLKAITKTHSDPLLNRTFGAIMRGSGDNWKSNANNTLQSKSAAEALSLQVHVLTKITDTAEAWVQAIEQQADDLEKLGEASRPQAHADWWAEFWGRSWIFAEQEGTASIPAKQVAEKEPVIQISGSDAGIVTQGYTLQRYINACAGRGEFPIKFNGSLFTVDNTEHGPDYRRWGGAYWWQNTRLPYWAMLEAGDYDMMLPLFEMYMKALPMRELATRTYYRHDGATFPETMSFWGTLLNADYGINRKGLADGVTTNGHVGNLRISGSELTAMMIRYYHHTGDEKFLTEILLPFAHEIVTFYDNHYKRGEDSKLILSPLNALEDVWDATNPAHEIIGLRVNLKAMMALTPDKERRKQYQRILNDLPEIPVTTDDDGNEFIAHTSPLQKRHGNAEKPELYGVFPFLLHGIGRQDLDKALLAWKYSVKRFMNGPMEGWLQNIIFNACLGNTDQASSNLVRRSRMVEPGFRFPAFWHRNLDWVPDQDHGSVNMIALQKMLMQPNLSSEGDQIFLLGAWPEDWSAHFKLHAPKNTTVEGRIKDGKITELKVTPESRRKDILIRQGDELIPAN